MTARMSRTPGRGWAAVLALGILWLAGCSHSSHSRSDSVSAAGTPPAVAATNSEPPSSSVTATTAAKPPPEALYAGQKTCPVTGAVLGSMGPAVPVNAGGMTIYVCCQACVAKVQGDPATYVLKVEAERAGRSDTPSSAGGCCKSGQSGGGCCGH